MPSAPGGDKNPKVKYFTLVKACIVCPLDTETSAVTYVLLRSKTVNRAYMQSSYSKPKKKIQVPSSSLFMLFQSPSIFLVFVIK